MTEQEQAKSRSYSCNECGAPLMQVKDMCVCSKGCGRMNREQTKAAIEVMQAYVDGAEIEFRYRADRTCPWLENQDCVSWNWKDKQYRVKPKPREIWVSVDSLADHTILAIHAETAVPGYIKFREVTDE